MEVNRSKLNIFLKFCKCTSNGFHRFIFFSFFFLWNFLRDKSSSSGGNDGTQTTAHQDEDIMELRALPQTHWCYGEIMTRFVRCHELWACPLLLATWGLWSFIVADICFYCFWVTVILLRFHVTWHFFFSSAMVMSRMKSYACHEFLHSVYF